MELQTIIIIFNITVPNGKLVSLIDDNVFNNTIIEMFALMKLISKILL